LLPARGFAELDGNPLTAEDVMAHLVDVTIRPDEPADRYRFPMRASADPEAVGGSPTGFARAVALASRGGLMTVPVPGRDRSGRPQLTPAAWDVLFAAIEAGFLAGELDVVFNYEADQLLAARDAAYDAANLARHDAASLIPRDTWGVGHYAPLGGFWRRPSGERWLLVLNSFKARGFAGIEPQPAELMRRGVVRDDGRGGGVLVVAPKERGAELMGTLAGAGLELAMWDNGSLPPDGWSWKPGI
jgi:hypothetical protein